MAKPNLTKSKIAEALLNMLSEKNIDDITVDEVIGLAGVSRSSFYRNFRDIYDVYDSMLENFAAKCMRYIEQVLALKIPLNEVEENITDDWHAKDKEIFDDVDYTFFTQAIYSSMSTMLLRRMTKHFIGLFKELLLKKGLEDEKAEFYASFILESLLSLYSLDLKSNSRFSVGMLEAALRIISNCG